MEKKKVLIVGVGPYAVMLKKYIDFSEEFELIGFVIGEEFIEQKNIDGKNVFPIERMENSFDCERYQLIMGIGYREMGNIRKRVFELCKKKGYKFANFIHSTATISPDTIIGEGNNIFENVLIQAGVKIGNANLIYGRSVIGHDCEMCDYNSISLNVTIAGCVKIGNNCFLGAGATTKDHICISDYALIGASAYAFRDIDPYKVIVPAKCVQVQDRTSLDYF